MYLAINTMAYLGVPSHLLFIPLFLYFDIQSMALFNVFSVIAWIISWQLNRSGRHLLAINIMTIEAVMHSVLATLALGWYSGFQFYLMPVIPAAMFNDRMRTSTITFIAFILCVTFIGLSLYTGQIDYGRYAGQFMEYVRLANIIVVFAALGIITFYFRKGSEAAERRMEDLAGTDQLTRIPNRRRLQTLLESERLRSERKGYSFAIVLADIDHFKAFNDERGHDCGDFVLKNVARLLRQGMRRIDFVGRWGGEEFLILLPESGVKEGMQVAERLRERIAQEEIIFDGNHLRTTLTFGVAQHSPGTALGMTLKRADAALYAGKQAGRNRVMNGEEIVTAEPDAAQPT